MVEMKWKVFQDKRAMSSWKTEKKAVASPQSELQLFCLS
ncbi:hypothetical protein EMIT079MI2_190013 [Bacillus sp. IT-79MI2]|nr:hypothetical protein BTH41_02446 [Bacillus mycoides]